MADPSTLLEEIKSQPEVWGWIGRHLRASQDLLGSILFSQCWDLILFTGSGSSHYLALAAANLHQQLTGQQTQAVPSAEIALFPAGVYPDLPRQQVLLVAISRSGETSETLWAVERQQHRHQPTLAITCNGDGRLAQESDVVFVAHEAREESVPQTRSFSSMYLATQFVAGLVASDDAFLAALQRLPTVGEVVLDRYSDLVGRVGEMQWQRVIFLGSGAYYGLACEAMLKLKEMALGSSEAYHFLEFRHGPISLVNERTLVVGFLSDTAAAAERAVLEDVRRFGGQALVIGEHLSDHEPANYVIDLRSDLPELARGPLYLLPLQLLAYAQARMLGLDPSRPRHLQPTVVLAPA